MRAITIGALLGVSAATFVIEPKAAIWLLMSVYGAVGVALNAMWVGPDKFLSILTRVLQFGLFAPLVTRLRPEDLENQNRKEVEAFILENPGSSIQEIKDAVGVAWGTAVYHLDRLRRQGKVVGHREGNHHRYWVAGTPEARVRRGWAVLEQPTTRDVAMAVATMPGLHAGGVCEAVAIKAPSASKHLAKLEKSGLVEKQRISRYTIYQPTEQLSRILSMQGTEVIEQPMDDVPVMAARL